MSRPYEGIVREFHKAFDRPARDLPNLGSPAERVLRVRLMMEELLEFATAAGIGIDIAGVDGETIQRIDDLDIYPTAYGITPNLPQMAHELADLQYVVSGTAVQLGIPLQRDPQSEHAQTRPRRAPDRGREWEGAKAGRVGACRRGESAGEILTNALPSRVLGGRGGEGVRGVADALRVRSVRRGRRL